MSDYYARDGQPLDLHSWAAMTGDLDYKRVAETWVDDGVWVSTVWLGLDHNFMPDGPPLIFETMIFASHLAIDGETWRCSTEAQAKAMHQLALLYVNDSLASHWGRTDDR